MNSADSATSLCVGLKISNAERLNILTAMTAMTDEECFAAVKERVSAIFKRKAADWKEMDLLRRYYVLQHYYRLRIDGVPKMGIYATLYALYEHSDSTIRRWVKEFETGHYLLPSAKGCHKKIGPGLDSIELIAMFKSHCNAEIAARKQPTTMDIAKWVNEDLLADKVTARGKLYSDGTVGVWMKGLGFSWGKFKKLTYFDGHEAAAQKQVFCE